MKIISAFLLTSFFAFASFASLSPSRVTFGNIDCNMRTEQSITFHNTSNEVLTNVQVSVSGASFALVNTYCQNVPAYGGSCSIRVSFWPNRPGTYSGALWVSAGYQIDSANLTGYCR